MMVDSAPRRVSETLSDTARLIPAEGMTLRQLLSTLGEQGLLVFCVVLTVPFVLPVQIPGLSTVFGLLIALIALGVAANRSPRFPRWLIDRRVHSAHLVAVLEYGARLFARLERWGCPRWTMVIRSAVMKRVTAVLLLLAAGLLALPLFIPLSNILPALAILLLVVGILQGDGLFILGGYALTVGTAVYFVGATIVAIHGLHAVIGAI
jgi:hypothetical protein